MMMKVMIVMKLSISHLKASVTSMMRLTRMSTNSNGSLILLIREVDQLVKSNLSLRPLPESPKRIANPRERITEMSKKMISWIWKKLKNPNLTDTALADTTVESKTIWNPLLIVTDTELTDHVIQKLRTLSQQVIATEGTDTATTVSKTALKTR